MPQTDYGATLLQSLANLRQEDLARRELERQNQMNIPAAITGLLTSALLSGKLKPGQAGGTPNWGGLMSEEALAGGLTGAISPVYGGMKDVAGGGVAGLQTTQAYREQRRKEAEAAMKPYQTLLEAAPQSKRIALMKKFQKPLGLEGIDLSGLESTIGQEPVAEPGFYYKKTIKSKPGEEDEITRTQTPIKEGINKIAEAVAMAEALRENKPLFERMSAKTQEAINEAPIIPGIIIRAKELVGVVPGSPITAPIIRVASDTPFATETQQALRSNMTILTQSILKMYQGSRPSDRDFEIMNKAVDASGKNRKAFLSAFKELEELFTRRVKILNRNISIGYKVPLAEIEALTSPISMPGTQELPEGTRIKLENGKEQIVRNGKLVPYFGGK